jgi:predicted SprT family Zn-dependent metalloprotease
LANIKALHGFLAYTQRGPTNGPLEECYEIHLLTDQIVHGETEKLLGIITHELIHKRVMEVYPEEEEEHGPKFVAEAAKVANLLRALGGDFFPDLAINGYYR